ncbi:MAG TPA: hypothetical protein VE985_10115 [Gaiellaceae bacterium]|nr:hypothetical protein [Gaiellaceae bacterium]
MNGTWGRTSRLIGAGFAIAALVACASAGGAAAATSQPAILIGSFAPVLASGVAPVTSGTVTATVTPDLQTIGGSTSSTVVASAPISSSGSFALYANPGSGPMASIVSNAIANNNGWVNMDLTEIGSNGEVAIQSISRQFTGGGGVPITETAIQSDGGNASSIGSWAGDGAVSDSSSVQGASVDPSTYVVIRQPSAAAASAAATENATATQDSQTLSTTLNGAQLSDGSTALDPCVNISEFQDEKNVDTVVGELHTANDTTATFTYGHTADTSADVGIELAGSGVYNVSGSVHIGNDRGTGAQEVWSEGTQFGYKLESGFLYKHYYVITNCGSNYYKVVNSEWTASPDGKKLGDYIHNLDNNCKNSSFPSNQQGKGQFVRNSNAFTHFSVAFSVFGFGGGARSGSSQYVISHWWFGTDQNHYLCGNDNYIPYAHRIFAGFG